MATQGEFFAGEHCYGKTQSCFVVRRRAIVFVLSARDERVEARLKNRDLAVVLTAKTAAPRLSSPVGSCRPWCVAVVVFTRCCSLQEFPRFPTDPLLGPVRSYASSTTMQKRWVGVHLLSRRVLNMPPWWKANVLRSGADGEEDGGVAEVLGLLLALLLCVRYWGCSGDICLTVIMHFTWAFHRGPSCGGYPSHAGADPFGFPTLHRPWNEGTPMDAAKRRLQAAFEFFTKLGVRNISFHSYSYTADCECLSHCALSVLFQVKYYTFHDR